jgi:hypothetical protein
MRPVACLAFVLLTLPILTAISPGPIPVPDTLASPFPGQPPIWVAADVALDAQGSLRVDLFDDRSISMLERGRRSNPVDPHNQQASCVSFSSMPHFELPAPSDTMAQLAKNSVTVESGEIVGSRAGFSRGVPGRLLAVREVERLKDMGGLHRRLTYVFVSDVRIDTTRGSFCSSNYGITAPQLGDEVLYFDYFPANGADRSLASIDPRRQLIIGRGSRVYAPAQLTDETSVKSFQEIVARIRSLPGLGSAPSKVGTDAR